MKKIINFLWQGHSQIINDRGSTVQGRTQDQRGCVSNYYFLITKPKVRGDTPCKIVI